MKADQLLQEAGLAMGLSSLQFDARGCARLVFDGQFAVNFENDRDAGVIQVYSVIGKVPADRREATYRRLLQANLFGAETAGATLAYDALADEVVLCRRVDAERHDAASFVDVLEKFVACAEAWTGQLREAPRGESPRGTTESLPPQAFLRA